jgi:dCTP deaminase
MILSDREIRAAIARGALKITPNPPPLAWSSTALDLRLAKEVTRWKRPQVDGVDVPVSPFDPNYDFASLLRDNSDKLDLAPNGFVMRAGTFLLGWTIEKLQLPHQSRLAARVEGKSSLARLGLGVHVTAPTIHAGFGYKTNDDTFVGSPLQLEIWNIGPLDIKLEEGMPVCQIIFRNCGRHARKGLRGALFHPGPHPFCLRRTKDLLLEPLSVDRPVAQLEVVAVAEGVGELLLMRYQQDAAHLAAQALPPRCHAS